MWSGGVGIAAGVLALATRVFSGSREVPDAERATDRGAPQRLAARPVRGGARHDAPILSRSA
jgi:hypothetical protein